MKITVKVLPRSGRQDLEIVAPGELRCHLQSPPEGGRASKELLELLADTFRLPKRSVAVVTGFTSRLKVVEVVGVASWDELVARMGKG